MPGRIGVGSQVSEDAEPVLDPRCTARHEADGGRQQGQGRAGQARHEHLVHIYGHEDVWDQLPETQFSEEDPLDLCSQRS